MSLAKLSLTKLFLSSSHDISWLKHSVQFSSVTQLCLNLCNSMDCSTSLSITYSQSLLKLMSIELGMPSNDLIFCRPLLPLPSIFPSIRVFLNQSVLLIRWPKYWSFSFSINPFNENSGLISFRMNCLDLFAVQRTLLWCSAFLMVLCLIFKLKFIIYIYICIGKT